MKCHDAKPGKSPRLTAALIIQIHLKNPRDLVWYASLPRCQILNRNHFEYAMLEHAGVQPSQLDRA